MKLWQASLARPAFERLAKLAWLQSVLEAQTYPQVLISQETCEAEIGALIGLCDQVVKSYVLGDGENSSSRILEFLLESLEEGDCEI